MKKIGKLTIFVILTTSLIFSMLSMTPLVFADNDSKKSKKGSEPLDQTPETAYNFIAEWRNSNSQSYLYIEAPNHLLLGIAEGYHLKNKILYLKNILIQQSIALNLSYKDYMLPLAMQYEKYIPLKYKIELIGMAIALYNEDVSYQDLIVQNCMWDIFYGILTPQMSGYAQPPLVAGGCSAIAFKDNNDVRVGQNIDLTQMMTPACSWVYHKVRGSPSVFSFRIGSQLAFGGINTKNIAISVNLVETLNLAETTLPVPIKYRLALESSNSIKKAMNVIINENYKFGCGWQFLITKKNKEICSIETIPSTFTFKIVKDSYTYDANIYETELFKNYMIPPIENMLYRHLVIPQLCESFISLTGGISLTNLMEILSYDGIARTVQSSNVWEVETSGFYSFDHSTNKGYFGLGNARDTSWGTIPF